MGEGRGDRSTSRNNGGSAEAGQHVHVRERGLLNSAPRAVPSNRRLCMRSWGELQGPVPCPRGAGRSRCSARCGLCASTPTGRASTTSRGSPLQARLPSLCPAMSPLPVQHLTHAPRVADVSRAARPPERRRRERRTDRPTDSRPTARLQVNSPDRTAARPIARQPVHPPYRPSDPRNAIVAMTEVDAATSS